jgi:predicted regulator of Ras-like GTPase activity (Roadblock/LC7/MglB family)
MLAPMDAAQAIADLTEISPQVRQVAVVEADGQLAGSNLADEAAAQRLVDGARRLIEAAEELRPGLAQLEAATVTGSVFVVRDGARLIAATTTPEPTVGLVFYDLKTCLRSIDQPDSGSGAGKADPSAQIGSVEPTPKRPARRRPPAKKEEADDGAS